MPPHKRGDQQSHHVGHLHPHHVDERQEVQAQGRCEPAQESTREEQGVPEGQLSLRTIFNFLKEHTRRFDDWERGSSS